MLRPKLVYYWPTSFQSCLSASLSASASFYLFINLSKDLKPETFNIGKYF